MKILLTGATGFVGRHFQNQTQCVPLEDPQGHRVDLRDGESLRGQIKTLRFDAVVHLAGKSSVAGSFENPREIYEINFFGTFQLLEVLKESGFKGRMLFAGSGEEYGWVPDGHLPVEEDLPLRPRNPYAVSKVAAEALCYQTSQDPRFEIIMTRSFNHIGPGQGPNFVISDWAKQISEIKNGLREPILWVGNIDVTRDFTDVRDVVRAYRLLLEKGKNGEMYNVCSGKEWRLGDLLDKMLALSAIRAEVKTDPKKLRKIEQKRLVGSFEKLNRETGWSPTITIDQTLRDVLSHWERKL